LNLFAELLQMCDLVGLRGDQELAVLLESGVDRVASQRCDESLVVLPRQSFDLLPLIGEVPLGVPETVRQRRVREATVASGRPLPDPIGIDQDDVSIGIVFLRLERCPEPGEAAADDR
jgi:hypothetical protein